jgi:DivIVA domain-containing protein
VALDRQTIMRDDFPSNRRGYDPAAVDAHLDRIADEVDDMRRQAAAPAPLSAQAGEQVKAIVEAAERGAQEIRDEAHAEAREHVARVTVAADRLRERIEQMERDMTQLVVDLRSGAERLRGDLDELQAGTGELGQVRRDAEPPAADPEPAAAPESEPEPAPAAAAPATKNGDSAAARIVALDMALSGTPREDTDQYLAENYDLPDRSALLDEVYAAAGG